MQVANVEVDNIDVRAFNALENAFVFGQRAERVLRSPLQAGLRPEEGRSQKGGVVEVASPCKDEG